MEQKENVIDEVFMEEGENSDNPEYGPGDSDATKTPKRKTLNDYFKSFRTTPTSSTSKKSKNETNVSSTSSTNTSQISALPDFYYKIYLHEDKVKCSSKPQYLYPAAFEHVQCHLVLNTKSIYGSLKWVSIYVSIVLILVTLYKLYLTMYSVRFERLIVAEKLGFQVEIHYNYGCIVKYIAWEQIKSILINEVISKQRVIFMLALLVRNTVEDDDSIIPLFTNVMPRLECLETIYQQIEIFQK
ncbi:hypothetical protein RN001_001327 [Aquatica leii]|uniref:Phosphatidylinositol N-acetylglucosaminyltransferase subunit H conserved domain-containing protein n=1 Tax=Aquatica leii TaxID=1421715 RepID=A0AAN7PL40_9COLE|nr:hypothetical protein RN001_001327 [Aquatica leii]